MSATAKKITATTPDGGTNEVLELKNCAYASYRLANLTVEVDESYTFSIRLKASSAMQVEFNVLGHVYLIDVSDSWENMHFTVEKPLQNYILISPKSNDQLLLWQAMLQTGTVATGWVPAIEDTNEKLEFVTSQTTLLHQDVEQIRLEAQYASEDAEKKYATKSELAIFADSITLRVSSSDGTSADIKISADGTIALDGTTLAQYIDVKKLMARDMTVTGLFNVDNGEYVLTSDGDTINIGRPRPDSEDPEYYPSQISFSDGAISIGGAGSRNLVGVNISGDISMNGNLSLRSVGAYDPTFYIKNNMDSTVGWMGYKSGSTGSSQTDGIGVGTTDGGYFLATDSGVRAQIGDYSFYITKTGLVSLTGANGTVQINDGGVYITGPLYHRNSKTDSWKQL